MTLHIQLNGQPQTRQHPCTLQQFLESLALPALDYGIAVSLNDEILNKTLWPQRLLQEGDVVEVIQATQGG